jgi:hypothetical protein
MARPPGPRRTVISTGGTAQSISPDGLGAENRAQRSHSIEEWLLIAAMTTPSRQEKCAKGAAAVERSAVAFAFLSVIPAGNLLFYRICCPRHSSPIRSLAAFHALARTAR